MDSFHFFFYTFDNQINVHDADGSFTCMIAAITAKEKFPLLLTLDLFLK